MTPEDRSSVADGPLDGTDTLVLGAVRELFSRTDPMPSGLTDRIKFELTLAAGVDAHGGSRQQCVVHTHRVGDLHQFHAQPHGVDQPGG